MDKNTFAETLGKLESRLLTELFYKRFQSADSILQEEEKILKFTEVSDWLLKDIDILDLGLKTKEKLYLKGITTLFDIVFLRPLRFEDYSLRKLKDLKDGDYCAIKGILYSRKRRKKISSITIAAADGFLECNWFRLTPYIRNLLKSIKLNDEIICEGQVRKTAFGYYINHPRIKKPSDFLERKEIIYPSLMGMRNATLKKIVADVLKMQPDEPYDYLPYTLIARNKLPFLSETVELIHKAESGGILEKRLKYEEIFLLILGLKIQEMRLKEKKSPKISTEEKFLNQVYQQLDFDLTKDQKRVVKEILNDLDNYHPMLRLLQGDVGCGKTIVALIASIAVIKSGYQVAFMAPTQPLAMQIFNEAEKLSGRLNFKADLLLSSSKNKNDIYKSIKNAETDLIVGTHALLQEDVEFKKLGFAVIDEQHRFGVEQRKKLMVKGLFPHILIMSATPIPRSLSMVLYSKSSLSTIREKPEGRMDVKSFHFTHKNRKKAYDMAIKEMKDNHQVYVVAPLIEESENADEIENVTNLYDELRDIYFKDFSVGLLHGRMGSKEKEGIIKQFKEGKLDCIVSTTVIEVGIDSPNATVMIVENAERFGLSQLHQLRGRVGRGKAESYAIFITKDDISSIAKKRIKALLDTNDGFKIAEIDYELRGAGEIMGIKQHGRDLIYTNLTEDKELIQTVKNDVERLIKMRYPINEGLKKMIEYKWQTKINYVYVG